MKKANLIYRHADRYGASSLKKKLMDILVCPVCKGELKLTVQEEKGGEIITGELYCAKCNVIYPIKDSIPRLLPVKK